MTFAALLLMLAADPVPGPRATRFADTADLVVAVSPKAAAPGQTVTVSVTVTPKPGFHTYPSDVPPAQAAKNVFQLPKSGDLIFVSGIVDPDGIEPKPGSTDLYYPGGATWKFTAVVSPKAGAGPKQLKLSGTRIQVCDESNCFYATPTVELEVAGPPVPVERKYAAAVESAVGPPTPPPGPAGPTDAATPAAGGGLWVFLATAAVWGWISLATPCVFPMIPITVSLFLKQSHQSAGGTLKLAAVYCLTIVVVLGLSAVALLSVFRKLSVDPYMNIGLGALFVVFALSLFGAYDLTLPGGLLRFTEKRRVGGGMAGTVFGALAFSIVSFTCVAPFLGGFAGLAASKQFAQWELVAGGLTFAAAFASPFFVLALFPSLLKKLPKSGGWLDTVKAVMGFLELAAALKFFRTAELRLLPRTEYFSYDLVLAGWVVTAAACGLYLLGFFRLPHDDEEKSRVGVTRLLIALGFLGLAVYLAPALLRTPDGKGPRPGGVVYAWVDSFLLPDTEAGVSVDLPGEVEKIASHLRTGKTPEKRLIFVDFTGVTCTNCKYNEQNIFPRPEVKALLDRYVTVQLYTDTVPAALSPASAADRDEQAAKNLDYQRTKYGTEQLPLYVILEPQANGEPKVLGVYDEGKINDAAKFAAFLRGPLGGK